MKISLNSMPRIVLATGNTGKVNEMQQTLQQFGFEMISQKQLDVPEAIEDGLSFVENALIKARNACQHTGLPAIADDSGLEVDALDGAPGIYSSRFAGDYGGDVANNKKLLTELHGVTDRSACFQCVIVLMQHQNDPTPIICQGSWQGEIAQAPAGDNGFGYDPVFYIPELQCHAANLTAEQKRQYSHRGKALDALKLKIT